jgi:hypothetical protein
MTSFTCPECGKTVDGDYSLSYHRKVAHNVQPGRPHSLELEDALGKMKGTLAAGIACAAVTVLLAVLQAEGFGPLSLIDAAIILGLSVGVYKKSTACAVALFAAWIVEKGVQWYSNPGTLVGFPVAALIGYFFFQGIVGTRRYARLTRSALPDAVPLGPGEPRSGYGGDGGF